MALPRRAAVLLTALPWAMVLALGTAALSVTAWLVLACADLLAGPFVRRKAPPTSLPPTPLLAGGARRAISCVTVSWNGRHFLEQLLPSLAAELERWGHEAEIIVVDNGSEDGTVAWLGREWPDVRVVALPENRFFVRGCMAGIEAARHPTLVVLNNDMIVEEGFLPPLLKGLERPGVFAVSSQIFLQDPSKRREESGLTGGGFHHGVLKLAHLVPVRDQNDGDAVVPTLWAGGGSSAYDREAFLALGGFDTLYDPFYVEDLALSYAAWTRGMAVVFAPDSRVRHAHRGTSRKAFGDRYVDAMIRRNMHLFVWKMVHDPGWTFGALMTVPLLVLKRWRGPRPFGHPWLETSVLLRALSRFPRALVERQRQRRHRLRSDREVLALARSMHLAERSLGGSLGREGDGPLRLLFLAGTLEAGGGAAPFFDLLSGLAARGHRISLLALGNGEPRLAAPLEARGVRVEFVTWRGDLPTTRAAVAEVLATVAFDVVQVDGPEMARVAAPLLEGLPVVHAWHGTQGFRDFACAICPSEEDAAALRRLAPRASVTVVAADPPDERVRGHEAVYRSLARRDAAAPDGASVSG